jgi:hypothetical protein
VSLLNRKSFILKPLGRRRKVDTPLRFHFRHARRDGRREHDGVPLPEIVRNLPPMPYCRERNTLATVIRCSGLRRHYRVLQLNMLSYRRRGFRLPPILRGRQAFS